MRLLGLVRETLSSPTSWIPYSEIESLRRTASSRRATLCCFEPVKCWSRLPYDSGGTTRRSKRRPSFATTVAFVLPLATISSTQARLVKYSMSAFGSLAVAMMSRSRTCSFRRRTLPASLTWSAVGCSRRTSTTARTAGSACPSSGFRSIFFRGVASALRTFSSVLGPSPVRVRSRSDSAACLRSSSVSTPSSCQMRRAVFGPSPGRCMNSTTSGGTRCSRLASASMRPSSTIWTIFSSIVLPIPDSSFARPSIASWAIEPPVSRMRCAARRYASGRNWSLPSSSRKSANRSN